jgi:hypothetical protein
MKRTKIAGMLVLVLALLALSARLRADVAPADDDDDEDCGCETVGALPTAHGAGLFRLLLLP